MSKKLFGLGIAFYLILLNLSFNIPQAKADEEQAAYDVCSRYWNTKRRSLGRAYVFVAGVSARKSYCFWRYNKRGVWNDGLVSETMRDCRKKYRRCFVFGSSRSGLNGWAQTVSNSGGSSRGTIKQRNTYVDQYIYDNSVLLYQQMMDSYNRQRNRNSNSVVMDNGPALSSPSPNCPCKTPQGRCRVDDNGNWAYNC